MTYHVDGYVLDKNPSPRGGGFTIVTEANEHIVTHVFWKPGYTNNDGELAAIAYAAHIAQPGDTIITDSQPAWHWARSGWPKARPDLTKMAVAAQTLIKQKRLNLKWERREFNLAGHHNETMKRP